MHWGDKVRNSLKEINQKKNTKPQESEIMDFNNSDDNDEILQLILLEQMNQLN